MNRPIKTTPQRDFVGLVGFVALCLAVSGLGGLVSETSLGEWYQTLRKPPFNPPDWVFAPVWTAIYVMMAVAAWRAWRLTGLHTRAMAAFGVQLFLNLLWSVLFFGLRSPGLALIEIAVLWVAIAWTAVQFGLVDRWAGLLFLPYLVWVAFAITLNGAIWHLN